MKKSIVVLSILVMSVVVASFLAGASQPGSSRDSQTTRDFMRAKLMHAQMVLEGLTIANLEMVAKHSQDMSLLSQDVQWQVMHTPEYVHRSAEFRREVDAMTEAARSQNLDAATLAYVKVTLNCVDCHKYVRSANSR